MMTPAEGHLPEVEVRLAGAGDAGAVLAFIAAMGFTPRTMQTWEGLAMGAMTAWAGGRLIGAIPYEPREVQGNGETVWRAWHETCVAVDPAVRGTGLGTRMQAALAEAAREAGQQLLTVYREDPESAAYRWYGRCGFTRLMEIEGFYLDDPAAVAFDSTSRAEAAAFTGSGGFLPGEVRRDLAGWLRVHPYSQRYRFERVETGAGGGEGEREGGREGGEAVLGIGRLHSETERAEVLWWRGDLEGVLVAAAKLCRERGYRPLRVALAGGAGRREVVLSRFEVRWRFDWLGKAVGPGGVPDTAGWRYSSVDFA